VTDPLTPFTGALRARLDEALRAWLGGVRWRGEGDGLVLEGLVRARVDSGGPAPGALVRDGLRLQLVRPLPAERADPRWRQAASELVARFEGGDPGPVRAALAEWRPYASVPDHHYRRLARSTHGTVGMLRLGFTCNQDCGFCWQDRRWPAPPDALYRTWIDEFAALGADRLTLSGGEPTLHRDLVGLVAHAHARGLLTHLQTNAIKLRRPDYVRALIDAGLDGLLVSFHAAEAALSDHMTRAPGTWLRTVAGVDAALAAGLPVALNAVVDARNAAHLPDHAAFVVARWTAGPNPVRVVNYSHPSPYEDRALWSETLVPFDVLRAPLAQAVRTLESAGVTVHAAGTCGFPLCVLPDDSLTAAGIEPESADALDASARDWPAPCRACAVRDRCPGVRPEYLGRFGTTGLHPRPGPPPG